MNWHEIFDYREGRIYWKVRPANCVHIGQEAGRVSATGYHVVSYNWKTYKTHRIIAEMFIPNPENKATVNHINGNKLDNSIENLEWATVGENIRHAHATGLHRGPEQVPVQSYDPSTGAGHWYPSLKDTEVHGYRRGNVCQVARGNKKTHRNLHWSYA